LYGIVDGGVTAAAAAILLIAPLSVLMADLAASVLAAATALRPCCYPWPCLDRANANNPTGDGGGTIGGEVLDASSGDVYIFNLKDNSGIIFSAA
jgi:hypothetical protein